MTLDNKLEANTEEARKKLAPIAYRYDITYLNVFVAGYCDAANEKVTLPEDKHILSLFDYFTGWGLNAGKVLETRTTFNPILFARGCYDCYTRQDRRELSRSYSDGYDLIIRNKLFGKSAKHMPSAAKLNKKDNQPAKKPPSSDEVNSTLKPPAKYA